MTLRHSRKRLVADYYITRGSSTERSLHFMHTFLIQKNIFQIRKLSIPIDFVLEFTTYIVSIVLKLESHQYNFICNYIPVLFTKCVRNTRWSQEQENVKNMNVKILNFEIRTILKLWATKFRWFGHLSRKFITLIETTSKVTVSQVRESDRISSSKKWRLVWQFITYN